VTYIITDLCLRQGACTEVCPVDCIAPGEPEEQWPNYYIDPALCIDCGLCKAKCPYNAIWSEDDVPEELRDAVRANYTYFNRPFPA
jgi:ferredoxin